MWSHPYKTNMLDVTIEINQCYEITSVVHVLWLKRHAGRFVSRFILWSARFVRFVKENCVIVRFV